MQPSSFLSHPPRESCRAESSSAPTRYDHQCKEFGAGAVSADAVSAETFPPIKSEPGDQSFLAHTCGATATAAGIFTCQRMVWGVNKIEVGSIIPPSGATAVLQRALLIVELHMAILSNKTLARDGAPCSAASKPSPENRSRCCMCTVCPPYFQLYPTDGAPVLSSTDSDISYQTGEHHLVAGKMSRRALTPDERIEEKARGIAGSGGGQPRRTSPYPRLPQRNVTCQ
jgi:hypothetical protein